LFGVGDNGAASRLARPQVQPYLRQDALQTLIAFIENGVRRGHAGPNHHNLVGFRLLPRVPEMEAETLRRVDPPHRIRVLRILIQNPKP